MPPGIMRYPPTATPTRWQKSDGPTFSGAFDPMLDSRVLVLHHGNDAHIREIRSELYVGLLRPHFGGGRPFARVALLIDQQAYQDYISSVLSDDGFSTFGTTMTSQDVAESSVLSRSDDRIRITVKTNDPSTSAPSVVTPKWEENSCSIARSKDLGVLNLGDALPGSEASSSSSSDPPLPPSPEAVSPRAEMAPRTSNGRWVQRWPQKHVGASSGRLLAHHKGSSEITTTIVTSGSDENSNSTGCSNDLEVLRGDRSEESSQASSGPPMPPTPAAAATRAERTPRISSSRWVQRWTDKYPGTSRPLMAEHLASSKTSTKAPAAKADESFDRYADKRTLHLEQRVPDIVRGRQHVDESQKTSPRFYWRDDSNKWASLRSKGYHSIAQRAFMPLSKESSSDTLSKSSDNLVSLARSEHDRSNRLHDPVQMQRSSATFWDGSEDEDTDSEDYVWTPEIAEAEKIGMVSMRSRPESTNKRLATPTYDIPASRQARTENLDCSRTGEAVSNLSATSDEFDLEPPPTAKKDNTQKSSIHQVFDQFETSFSSQQVNSTTRMPKYPFSNSLSPPTRDSQLEETRDRQPDFFLANHKSLIDDDCTSSPARLYRKKSDVLWQLWNEEGHAKKAFGKPPPREQVAAASVASNVYSMSAPDKQASGKQAPFSNYQQRHPNFDGDEEAMELHSSRFLLQPFRKCVQCLLD